MEKWKRDLDRYLTSYPSWYDDEYIQPRCPTCNSFISPKITEKVETTTKRWCDGQTHYYVDEYHGQEYHINYVQCESEIETNVREHEPHFYDYMGEIVLKAYCKRCRKHVVIDGESFPLR